MPDDPTPDSTMEAGVQPIDAVMGALGVSNHDLVAASDAHLTHKQVAKARKGRKLTGRMQQKVADALNAVPSVRGREEAPFAVGQLFTYRGR